MRHCDRQDLESFFRGGTDVDGGFLAAHAISCADCRRLAASVLGGLGKSGCDPRRLSPAAAALREILRLEEERAGAAVRAKGLVSVLLALDDKGRARFIRSDPRAQSADLVAALAKAAREKAPSDPKTAAMLCTYGLHLVDDLCGLPTRLRDALHAELLTEQANARRLQADRSAANELLDRAHRMAQEGAGGPALLARIGSIRASIRLDEGNPAEAILLLSDVRQTYERAGEIHQVGRTMVQIADIVSVFDPAGAYQAAYGALGYLSRQDDLRTRASALGMMVECLIEQGLVGEALRELQEHQAFLEQFCDPALQVRVRVMEARLAALLEHEEEALQLFANVIDECYERGLYQLMTSYQAFLLGFHVDRKKWTKAVELCAFAAGQEELPEGARQLWRKLEAATRTRTLAAGEIQEARRQLRADWAQMAVA
ncbi:MAG TPA: hypothetical protein DD490_26665 [Acidobacteria bacterium]|nr:hypothetical protein [Acidobacteriota bacterium]